MSKLGLLAVTLGILAVAGIAPAHAQQSSIGAKTRSKATWYNAPHEVQIIDERPVVRDFREAPQQVQQLQLPPGPGAHRGMYGGGGGAMGDQGDVLPSGGMPIGGGGDPGYRTPEESSVPLERVGPGHNRTNIPAGGLGPKGPLPAGYSTGTHAVVHPSLPNMAQTASPMSGPRRSAPQQAPRSTPVFQYNGGGGYGSGVGTATGNGGANTSVQGRLLNRIK